MVKGEVERERQVMKNHLRFEELGLVDFHDAGELHRHKDISDDNKTSSLSSYISTPTPFIALKLIKLCDDRSAYLM